MTAPTPAAIAAVILDMDGLLLDSERIAFEIGCQSAHDLGLPWREEVARAMIGRNAHDNAAMLRREYGPDYPYERHHAEFGRRYEAAIAAGAIPLKPGAEALLDRLDALALPRAVATSTALARARLKLERVGLLARVHAVVGGDEVPHGKPAPDIFLAAAARLGVAPDACLALEDSNAGARAARAAGMRVAMVPDLLVPDADLVAGGVAVLSTLFDVLEMLPCAPR